MYKIYVNDKPLLLLSSEDIDSHLYKTKNCLIARYPGKTKFLLNYIDLMEKKNDYEYVAIHHSDAKQLFKDFKSLHVIIKACGGLVYNDKGKNLFIYRNGTWDLPKGKMDPGETKKECAVREVKEECGLKNLELKEKLVSTFHTYKKKSGVRVLKPVTWYLMHSNDKDLKPQKSEGIKKVKWMSAAEFLKGPDRTFSTIYDVLLNAFKHA